MTVVCDIFIGFRRNMELEISILRPPFLWGSGFGHFDLAKRREERSFDFLDKSHVSLSFDP